jgi:hypothetical protein
MRDLDPAPAAAHLGGGCLHVLPPLSLCLFVCTTVVSCIDGLQLLPRLRRGRSRLWPAPEVCVRVCVRRGGGV